MKRKSPAYPKRTPEELAALLFVTSWTKQVGWVAARKFIEKHQECEYVRREVEE